VQVRPAWLPFLQAPEFLGHILMLVQNTLHSQLLERSLQLLAALLQADELEQQQQQQQQQHQLARQQLQADELQQQQQQHEQQQPHMASQQQHVQEQQQQPQQQPMYERLIEAGLVTAVEALLSPTVEAGPASLEALITSAANGTDDWDGAVYGGNPAGSAAAEPANSAAGAAAAAGNGGWSDDDIDMAVEGRAADVGDVEQRTRELYRSQNVLEMLLALLLQLGSCSESAAAALQQMPELPQVLLHVLVVSSSHRQQQVLEALLPVLVVFRDGVLPLMQPVTQRHLQLHMQQQQQEFGGIAAPAEQQQRQQQEAEEQQQQITGLCLLACIAGTLQDGDTGPQVLDALDAGWYLLALATNNLRVLELHLQQQQLNVPHQQQQQQEEEEELQLQQQQRDRRHALICNPASCKLLELLCTRLKRSPVPESAAAYVRATAHALATCVTAMLYEADRVPAGLQQQQAGDQQQQQQQQQQQGLCSDALSRMQMSMLQAAAAVSALASKVCRPEVPQGAEGLGEN
jgi:hypothetical protein